jgi:calcineurin-like phosphoesterase family protein
MSNGQKPTFYTADWHLGHANSIIFDKRPFDDLDHMHSFLIKNYNAQVPENGICYFLGDIATHSSELTKSILSQLNGTKVIIRGNHDKPSNALYAMGFDVVLNSATIYIAGQRVTMSHCPLRGVYREYTEGMVGAVAGENWHGESRHIAFSVANEGQFHLHGHIHSPNGGKSKKILGRQYDVAIPANGYKPVSMSTIESWIIRTISSENLKESE